MSYTRLNPPIRVTNCGADNVTISHGATYYANLGSISDVPGYVPVGMEITLSSMSVFSWLIPSALQNTGSGSLYSRIANLHPSANSTGSWSAKVYWAKA